MTDKIQKFLDSQTAKFREKLKKKLQAVKKNPLSGTNIKKLSGYGKNVFRLRVGDVRIIYVLKANSDIEILDIDYRGNIY